MWPVIQQAKTVFERMVVKGGLNPLLFMCVCVGLPCAVLAYYSASPIRFAAFFLVLLLTVVTTCFIAWHFALKDPSRLGSDEIQIKHMSFGILQSASDPKVIAAVVAIANPETQTLPTAHEPSELPAHETNPEEASS